MFLLVMMKMENNVHIECIVFVRKLPHALIPFR